MPKAKKRVSATTMYAAYCRDCGALRSVVTTRPGELLRKALTSFAEQDLRVELQPTSVLDYAKITDCNCREMGEELRSLKQGLLVLRECLGSIKATDAADFRRQADIVLAGIRSTEAAISELEG